MTLLQSNTRSVGASGSLPTLCSKLTTVLRNPCKSPMISCGPGATNGDFPKPKLFGNDTCTGLDLIPCVATKLLMLTCESLMLFGLTPASYCLLGGSGKVGLGKSLGSLGQVTVTPGALSSVVPFRSKLAGLLIAYVFGLVPFPPPLASKMKLNPNDAELATLTLIFGCPVTIQPLVHCHNPAFRLYRNIG